MVCIFDQITHQHQVFGDGTTRDATCLVVADDRATNAQKAARNSPSGNFIVHVQQTNRTVIFCFEAIIFLIQNNDTPTLLGGKLTSSIGKVEDANKVWTNIGAFCLRMRENRSVRLQMADLVVSFVMVFMKNMD